MKVSIIGGGGLVGSMTAYVSGPKSGDYDFTSALPVQLLTTLAPALMPLIEPPSDVTEGVHALMRSLGLVYGALDFVVTPEGEWVFLEVNPGGQYGWIESCTGAPLTSVLADLLTKGQP